MSLNYVQVCFLLLHLTLVGTQDGAEGQYVEQVQEEGGDEAAGQLFTGCEEGLEYMMFLREDIRLVLVFCMYFI